LNIRSIAICKIEDDGHIFVLEGYDPKKCETFYRPIGGGIEFGELAGEAAVREFREELDTEIELDSTYDVYENIFEFNGTPGHEHVFMLTARFKDRKFYEKRDFVGREKETEFVAKWVKITEFIRGDKILYPSGFVDALAGV
jgi:8-oxo-dGTP pyrophosphatase MutT (NUDIX family)